MEWTVLLLRNDDDEEIGVESETEPVQDAQGDLLLGPGDSVENVNDEEEEEDTQESNESTAGEEVGTEEREEAEESDGGESEGETSELIQIVEEVQQMNETLGQVRTANVLLIACLGLFLGCYLIRFMFDGLRDKT